MQYIFFSGFFTQKFFWDASMLFYVLRVYSIRCIYHNLFIYMFMDTGILSYILIHLSLLRHHCHMDLIEFWIQIILVILVNYSSRS